MTSCEVVQVIKQVKYNKKSNKMISVNINAYRQWKMKKYTRMNTHLKWRSFWTESPSSLHCTNWHGSPDHLVRRFSTRQCIGSTTSTIRISCYRVWIARMSPNRMRMIFYVWLDSCHASKQCCKSPPIAKRHAWLAIYETVTENNMVI